MRTYTPDDSLTLLRHAIELEDEYFRDMTLADYPEITTPLECLYDAILPSAENARYSWLECDEGAVGETSPADSRISMKRGYEPQDLAHELIHWYEHELDRINPALRQLLAVYLWRKTEQRIPDLDDVVLWRLEPVALANDVEDAGGEHDLLFLLKSLDIDLEMDLPLFTTYGYGMDEEWSARPAEWRKKPGHGGGQR